MPMFVKEKSKTLLSKGKVSDLTFVIVTGQLWVSMEDWKSVRKTGSMSVAWVFRPEGVLGDVRRSLETEPGPQALSWIVDPAGMEGRRERFVRANSVRTAPPVEA